MDSQTSLVIDASGTVHVIYYNEHDTNLEYAFKPRGGTWTKAPAITAGDVGAHNALAVDASGTLHAAFLDATNGLIDIADRCP